MPLLTTSGASLPEVPTPPTPAPGGGTAWGELEVSWTGWDGSRWVLSSPTSPVWLTPDGCRGLNMPPIDRFTSVAPAVAGSRWRGYRVEERPVFWPIFLYGNSTAEWRDVDRAWWRTMHPGATGVWTVAQPDGTRRHLTCRYADDNAHTFTRDPFPLGWAAYGIELVAEDPLWRGEPVRREFRAAAAEQFFGGNGGSGFGPPFHISPSTSPDEASVTHDGDEPAWAVWTLHGPFSSAAVGVGDSVVQIPFGRLAGQSLVVDTRPDRLTVLDSDGGDRVDDLGQVAFAPVPAGVEVPLTVTLAGETSATVVEVEVEPLYHRAW